ncbi:MAG: type II toxin-antitoxin system PemK/MazF family toxin [Deltaproteobacteria bacterium]|jgi:mRNA interferase MazF|nr:type II toxin-antitoxin system PemK/MazF family toxin [Deltaproteobacteria bacterium]
MEMGVARFEVYLVNLDPTIGSEIKKVRPCVVVSPDEMNRSLRTVIIAPMTTVRREHYPSRVDCVFQKKQGQIVLDQIRTIDRQRLLKNLGMLPKNSQKASLRVLQAMFEF